VSGRFTADGEWFPHCLRYPRNVRHGSEDTRLQKSVDEDRTRGDLLYENLKEVQDIIEEIKKARKKGLSDAEILARFAKGAKEGISEAGRVKKLSGNELVLEL